MASENRQLQIFFLPAMGQGHMIPMVDLARLFASRGVKATIVTTPVNATLISKSIQRTNVNILTFKFPSAEAGLPEGCENVETTPPHLLANLILASLKLRKPVDQIIRDHHPDCLVADYFYSWATEVAGTYNIPRIVFNATNFFTLCVSASIRKYQPFKNISSRSEPCLIPDLPDVMHMTMEQLPNWKADGESDMAKLSQAAKVSASKSYGDIINSFYELEPAYVDHYRNVLGKKAWHVGPLCLATRDMEEKVHRGKQAAIGEHEYLKWLDSKKTSSVIYVCFGSVAKFNDAQLREIGLALEASGYPFIWVVRRSPKKSEEQEEWLPGGFEERTEGRGLIIRGWAPQVSILEHQAIGAFMNHSGWNSVLESITAGVPMVTWPMVADNFVIEKLVTEILKIGVSVGVKRLDGIKGDSIKSEAIEKALNKIMAGEEAEEMRKRGKTLAELSKRAVEEGSSYVQLDAFIEEIALYRQR
uniref:UDP-glycosyltransferase n=1 Tax=Polygala tenuifolia TaxID=355332 RepID=A0A4P2X5R4_9FABA|nr:UDP-glycosyltransferase [Polygala tenuifolia]